MENETYKGYKIEVEQDEFAESPREWDNLGTMACFHRRYDLGDKHGLSMEQVHALESNDDYITLPLYLYDHGGVAISTETFIGRAQHAEWDSGRVGVIFVSKETLRKEFSWKVITRARAEKARKYLIAEVMTYNQFLSGDVWSYRILENNNEEPVSRCCGFYGSDSAIEEAKQEIDWILKSKEEDAQC